ncbi:hypothetical protein ABE545_17575 [Sphingobacterium faecium]|uniref:hypothetical protein n=1 Tax=Sphingobacterium faecium TaxID=34087 RepID=UPI00320AAF09
MTLNEKLLEIEEHLNLWMGNYSRKELASNNVRIVAEAICKSVILKKKGDIDGTKIILGKNLLIPKKRRTNKGSKLSFEDLISVIVNDLKLTSKPIELQLELIRNRTNPGSHSKNTSSDKTTLEDLEICNTSIKSIINWLYEKVLQIELSEKLKNLINSNKEIEINTIQSSEKWKNFEFSCEEFDTQRFQYILVSPENIGSDKYTVEGFTKLPWRLVLDFNPNTDTNELGLLNAFEKNIGLGKKKAYTINDKIEFDPGFPHYWFHLNGLGEVNKTQNYKQWRDVYKNFLSETLYKEFIKGSRIKTRILVLVNIESRIAYDIIDEFNRVDRANLRYVLCSDYENYEQIFDSFDNVSICKISPNEISYGAHDSTYGENEDNNVLPILIPHLKEDTREATFIEITKDHYDYLQTLGIEIVYKNIDKTIASDDLNLFYKGASINWKDLSEQKDISRSNLDNQQKKLELKLKENKIDIVKFIHQAGAGGSTLAKRIAFNLSIKNPTVLIRKYIHKKTIEGLRILYDQYTKGVLPLLIIIESFEVKDYDALYRDLSNAKKNAVIYVVHRGVLSKAKDKSFTLKGQLEGMDIPAFQNFYKLLAPESKDKISNIPKEYQSTPQYITPVLYALTAFGKNYSGLGNYVEKSLEGITLEQKKVIGFICLIYHYTQKSVPIELFSTIFGVDRSRCNLISILGEDNPLFSLLHQETDSNNEHNNFWRPRYAMLGEEAIYILLGGGFKFKENWRTHLATWLIELIKTVKTSLQYLDEETESIFKALFIERSHLDDNGGERKEFTKIFDDIISANDGRAIFESLILSYPSEAHYHGHFARYLYSDKVGIRDFDKAIEQANESLEISPENSSLAHTLGMCFKEKAESLMLSYDGMVAEPEEIEKDIQSLVESACENFDQCIELDQYNIYGYESQMRTILKVLDFGFKFYDAKSKELFISNPNNSWYAEMLDKVGNLLEEALFAIEQLKKVDNRERVLKSESFILDCESLFFKTLGQLQTAKFKFEELVKNTPKGYEYMRPHYRRMFVMCLLAYKKPQQGSIFESWEKISDAELNQCIDYLDANLIEDPNNVQNVKLWLQAIRHIKTPPPIFTAISRAGSWTQVLNQRENSLLEGYYYLYVLNAVKAISLGDSFDTSSVNTVKEILEKMKKFIKNEKFCFEWYGPGKGISSMVHHKKLGEYSPDFFDKNVSKLAEVSGRIKSIQSSQQGLIILDCGLEAFFVPNINGFTERNVNDRVKFYVGFRYDQIQAWSVLLLNTKRDIGLKSKATLELKDMIEEEDNTDDNKLDESNLNLEESFSVKIRSDISIPKVVGMIDLEKSSNRINTSMDMFAPTKNKEYLGKIKLLRNDGGYIEVNGLNKNIAFRSFHLTNGKIQSLIVNSEIKVIIKFVNNKVLLDATNRNYIAEKITLIS